MAREPKTCGCGKTLSTQNRSGCCAPCCAKLPEVRARKGRLSPEQRARRSEMAKRLSSDPAVVARRHASAAAARAAPGYRDRHAAACKAAMQRAMADPAVVERLREAGRKVGARNLGAGQTPEARAKAAAATRRRHLSWCPEEHWPLNATLKRKGYRLAERKAIILADVPGTIEHARRSVENVTLAMQIKHQRQIEQAY